MEFEFYPGNRIRYICKSKKIFRRQEPLAIILFFYIIYCKGSAAKKKSGSIWETFVLFFNFFKNVFISLHLLMWHMHPYTSVKEQLVGVDSYPSVDSGDWTEVIGLEATLFTPWTMSQSTNTPCFCCFKQVTYPFVVNFILTLSLNKPWPASKLTYNFEFSSSFGLTKCSILEFNAHCRLACGEWYTVNTNT